MLPQRNEEDKSLGRQYAEQQAKKQTKKLGKKLAKKGAKLAAKVVKVLAKQAAVLLGKLLAWLAGTVGLPVLAIVTILLVSIVTISLILSYFYGTGEGLEGEDRALYEYIVEQANSTVDMSNPIERPYRVPEQLIAATLQLDYFQKNEDLRDVAKKMAQALAPVFDYGTYNEWTEKQIETCDENGCHSGPVVRTDKMVQKLDHVDYWNGSTTFTYKEKVTDWVHSVSHSEKVISVPVTKNNYDGTNSNPIPTIEYEDRTITVVTTTKTRRQYFDKQEQTVSDYATYDAILNSYGLNLTDKRLIEANYMFTGGQIAYIEWLLAMGGGSGSDFIFYDGNIIPGAGVPPQYMPFYRSAEKKYGVPWEVLAAIHFTETGFSTHPTMVSSVGAVGHLQFMPATWVGWSYDIGGGLVSKDLDITSLAVIAKGRGYGKDGNGDGKADPWNVEDAIHTAASYIAASGYSKDPRKAIWHYNHAEWYVNKILTTAEKFKNAASYEGGGGVPPLVPGSFMKPAMGRTSSPFGYRSGGMHYGIDIASGGQNVPIVAAADGVVRKSHFSKSYGNVVYLVHNINGQSFESVYAHMVNRAVSDGAQVKQGQFLGYMGTTGNSSGIHLHFEIHLGGWTSNKQNAQNPAKYIQFD